MAYDPTIPSPDLLPEFRAADQMIADSIGVYDAARAASDRGSDYKARRLYAKSQAMHDAGWARRNDASAKWREYFNAAYGARS